VRGHVFVVHGDITRLAADAIAYSTDRSLSVGGQLTFAFDENVPSFRDQYRLLSRTVGPSKPAPGSAYWISIDDKKRPHGVIVTVATGFKIPREERAASAVRGALACAADNLAKLGIAKPWLITLPAFLTGDGGARHDRLSVAEPQIEAAEEFVRTNDDVDVAFVPYTEGTYQVYLEARRRVHARVAHDPPMEPPEELVESLRRGEGVIFVGSGVSLGSGLPSWSELVHELADELSLSKADRRTDLDYFLDLAQWYRDERRDPPLEARIRKKFSSKESDGRPTLSHYLLASLPARWFVTTNYDDLTECALEALRRFPVRVVREEDVARTGGVDGCYVVKVHGCAATGDEIVLSRDDYDDFFRRRPAIALLLEGLLLNQTFFFVGYGLRDPDFRQIYNRIAFLLRGAKRPAFATTFDVTTDHPKKQWRNKHLELLDVPGASSSEKGRRLERLLDRLAERVAEDPQLFLADDVDRPRSTELGVMRDHLLGLVRQVVNACHRADALPANEVRTTAGILRFLCEHGFRGNHPGELAKLFVALARNPELRKSERRDLLVSALRHTENGADASALLENIQAMR
jgi:O-acetyl-ADP-ribose deacetylase (regulator of RNase III)